MHPQAGRPARPRLPPGPPWGRHRHTAPADTRIARPGSRRARRSSRRYRPSSGPTALRPALHLGLTVHRPGTARAGRSSTGHRRWGTERPHGRPLSGSSPRSPARRPHRGPHGRGCTLHGSAVRTRCTGADPIHRPQPVPPSRSRHEGLRSWVRVRPPPGALACHTSGLPSP